jgi:hypothetical protein
LHHAAAGLRLSGHWFEMLSDLGMLGPVRLMLATPTVNLMTDQLSLAGLRVDGQLATLHGTGQSLRLLLDRCHALAAAPARDALTLEDDLGRPLVRLAPPAPGESRLWRLVLGGILGGAERVVPLRHATPDLAPLERHPLGMMQSLCDDGADAPGFGDTVELSGQRSLAPDCLRREAAARGGSVTAVDPALIPSALRSLCDEVLPIVVTVGSDALVLRRRAAFHAYAQVQGRARIDGDGIRVEIDMAAIDSAWVVGGAAGAGDRQLRLYDADGRALAVIAAAGSCCRGDHGNPQAAQQGRRPSGGEPPFWRSLMNALES